MFSIRSAAARELVRLLSFPLNRQLWRSGRSYLRNCSIAGTSIEGCCGYLILSHSLFVGTIGAKAQTARIARRERRSWIDTPPHLISSSLAQHEKRALAPASVTYPISWNTAQYQSGMRPSQASDDAPGFSLLSMIAWFTWRPDRSTQPEPGCS